MLDLASRVNFDENFGNLVSQLIPEDDTRKRYNDKPCACEKFTTTFLAPLPGMTL